MRDTFINLIRQMAIKKSNILLVTGDLGFGVLNDYRRDVPDQFINAGVAEQNMTGLAAGLSLCGYNVFTYSIGNFCSLRCLEQIRNDVCYHNANVKIISVGSGLGYGSLGMSHHATEDVSILRALPNIKIYSPSDFDEVCAVVDDVVCYNGPAYIRLANSKLIVNNRPVKVDEFNLLSGDKDCAKCLIITHGSTAKLAQDVVARINIASAVYTVAQLKPLPQKQLLSLIKDKTLIVTIEEHSLVGGFGSSVAEILCDNNINVPLLRLGLQDRFISIGGTQEELRSVNGLSVDDCVNKIADRIIA